MGTWYAAVLLYGFEITDRGDDDDDEFWDDPEFQWERSHGTSSVTFIEISWSYDGKRHVYMCPKKFLFKSDMYKELVFDMGELDKASIDADLEKVAKEVGVAFKKPGWHLMPKGY
jgi:hypothetical protein